jgi:hypothetical protein
MQDGNWQVAMMRWRQGIAPGGHANGIQKRSR